MANTKQFIPRDISWLSFNGRVLQEANDPTVPLQQRIRFLGIFSNNLDEFFRVRVATLKRMSDYSQKKKKLNIYFEENPQSILDEIQTIVLRQQNEFERIWKNIQVELKEQSVFLRSERQLNREQQQFVRDYFESQVRNNIIPLMIESLPQLPYIRDKSIYLGVLMRKQNTAYQDQYALIEVPVKSVGRFVELPSRPGQRHIILLEDIIRYNLPKIFPYFDFDIFEAWLFKVTKDAELEIDHDISMSFVEKMAKGIKNRRKGKPVRFVYDKEMDNGLLQYLISRLGLTKKSAIIPGGRIHNFRHFMDFPSVLPPVLQRKASFTHPALRNKLRVTDQVLQRDIMLHFPYHSFNSVIDLLREAAMDATVESIQITAYRLASESRIIHALINAARNGKRVTVMLELKARFDEEANLEWKTILEEEGITVLLGMPNMKVHAKLCVITSLQKRKRIRYGFVSTGNLNESSAKMYADHCLLTASATILNDAARVFEYLSKWRRGMGPLKKCRTLLLTPVSMRKKLVQLLEFEIKQAKAGKKAALTLKVNSLSDVELIRLLNKAATAGVVINLIVRGIYCPNFLLSKKGLRPYAISIVDEYLEHARVMMFFHGGKEKVYISSADWMIRNIDHRIEAAVEIHQPDIRKELKDILAIQLADNVKARLLEGTLPNEYVKGMGKRPVRSQIKIYQYLYGLAVSK
ncbi:MAG: polyphosphate kinase 1 [Sphingomonadales bacterium]|nr:polyphosphate kinase 1 [Sphingomonadales bacterium]